MKLRAVMLAIAAATTSASLIPAPALADPSWHNVFGSPWMLRARGLAVLPDAGSSDWAPGGVSALGPDIDINNTVVPEIDITYFITNNIAVELIAAVTPHTIDGRKGISGLGEVGDVWLLPPTLTLQYHFEIGNGIKPYVGAGINYTVFFGEESGASYTDLEIDNSFGFALQAGVDIPLRDNWYVNFDVKKLWLDTEASVKLNNGTRVAADVDVDPWIIGVGIGYRFGGPAGSLK